MRRGFTLLELLVVVAIVAFLAGMIAFLPAGSRREIDVRAAADELAATLRQARSLAMRQRAVHAVVFNICNGAGTSGKVLNNFDGGHWYRILGPAEDDKIWDANAPGLPWAGYFRDGQTTMEAWLAAISSSWVSERHVLPAKRVRFLALSDQDNGGFVSPTITWEGNSRNRFPPTYPRPWFGWYDAASGRLRPWGGYDHDVQTPWRGRCTGGFWYEGADGAITGSLNPGTRMAGATTLWSAGEARPVVNADWADYWILFRPDGTVAEGPAMLSRRYSWTRGFQAGAGGQNLGDRYEQVGNEGDNGSPMTSFVSSTGSWGITLAPDAQSDDDRFPNAQQALASLLPACRVTISRYGVVAVAPIRRGLPADAVIDRTITDWQDPAQTGTSYRWLVRTTGDTRVGTPVTTAVSEELLTARQWWLTP